MKFTIATILSVLAATAAAQTVTNAEADAYYDCTTTLINNLNNGNTGDRATCQAFGCWADTANQYKRGGIITRLAPVIEGVCGPQEELNGTKVGIPGTLHRKVTMPVDTPVEASI
ncbi:hypothetical protein BX600DRAFT_443695 [Xylariales sp. PMI_506]|nr:hypothetical protein BX600DRAFT_443695 [Xylariales sp. PMI_506]